MPKKVQTFFVNFLYFLRYKNVIQFYQSRNFLMHNGNSKLENKDRLRLEVALDIAQICIFEVSNTCNLIYLENSHSVFDSSDSVMTRRFKQFDGLKLKEYINRFSAAFVHPEDRNLFNDLYDQILAHNVYSLELRLLQATGKYVWCKITIEPIVEDNKVSSVIIAIMNISSSKEKMIQLELSNMMDNFTDLYNKTSSFEMINKAIENSRPDDRYAFAILDIDNFKQFNDTYGHDMGDEILKEVARTLRDQLNQKDCIVGRFGGDEFILLIKNYHDKEALTERLTKISTYRVRRHVCQASCGVSILNEDANTFSRLFKHADTALYEAKKTSQPVIFYSDVNKE